MAKEKEIIIDIKINDKGVNNAIKSFDKLDKRIDQTIDGLILLDDAFTNIDSKGFNNVSNEVLELNRGISDINDTINELNKSFSNVDISEITNVSSDIDAINDSIKQVNANTEQLNNNFNSIDVSAGFENLKNELNGVSNSVNNLSDDVKSLEGNVGDLGKESKDATKEVENLGESTEDAAKDTKKLDDNTKDTTKSVGLLRSGFKLLSGTLKGLGIGLVLAAVATLTKVISANQKVIDAGVTILNAATIAFNRVAEAVSTAFNNASELTGVFDATLKVIKSLITIGLAPLQILFNTLKGTILQLQLAYEESIFGSGDTESIDRLNTSIAEVEKTLEDLTNGVVESGKTIINSFSEAVDEVTILGKESIEELSEVSTKGIIDQAKAITQLGNSAQIAEAKNIGLIESYDIQAERLRQIRDNDLKSINDRIKANDELLVVLNDQEEVLLKNAQISVDSARAALELNKNTENQVALQDALNEQLAITAQVEGQRSEQEANRVALLREQIELNNSLQDSESQRNLQQQKFNAEFVDNEFERLLKLREVNDLEKEIEQERLESQIALLAEGTQARQDLEQELNDFLQENRQESLEIERNIQQERRKLYSDTFDVILGLTNEETALGRAALLAKQFIAAQELILNIKRLTFKASETVANSSLAIAEGTAETAKVGFPQNIPLLIGYAAQAAGIISSVKGALSTVSSLGAGGGAGNLTAPTIAAQPIAPSFNIVGTSDTNQLAQVVNEGNQNQQPIKAFVVASEVTTQQELDRQTQNTATIG